MFKLKTNLSLSIRLQPSTRVMYLNNSLISHGICNGTIGVVTNVNPEEYARIAFSVRGSIIDIDIYKHTHYFEINEIIAAVHSSPCRIASLSLYTRCRV